MVNPPDRAFSRDHMGRKCGPAKVAGPGAGGNIPWFSAAKRPCLLVSVQEPGEHPRDQRRGGQMAKQMELRCRCGEVVGRVDNASPQKVNRVVCYCDDCQAFAHQLGRADLLNAQGGSDIIQVAPASLTFIKGQNRIAGVRLTPKGLFRWYTTCCNTPV